MIQYEKYQFILFLLLYIQLEYFGFINSGNKNESLQYFSNGFVMRVNYVTVGFLMFRYGRKQVIF